MQVLLHFLKMQFLLFIALCAIASAQHISQLKVPMYADPRRIAEISCHFEMNNQKLQSIKLYREINEIFRYNPQHEPAIRLFNISEVMVESGECSPDFCVVRVMPKPEFTKAAYTCEVSTEGPKFQIAKDTKLMTVVAMPSSNPVIMGTQTVLRPGEQIFLNCTSDFSLPPSLINWYIDGELQKPEAKPDASNQSGLRRSWRGLRLQIPISASGTIRVRCESTILVDPPYVRETETIITIHSRTQLSKYVSANPENKSSKAVGVRTSILLLAYIEILRLTSL